jgi:hypothetical protein
MCAPEHTPETYTLFLPIAALLIEQGVGSVGRREEGKRHAAPRSPGVEALEYLHQPTQPTPSLGRRRVARQLAPTPGPTPTCTGSKRPRVSKRVPTASGSRSASRRSPSAFRAMDAPRTGHLAGPRTICPYQGSPPGSKSCLRPSAASTATPAMPPGVTPGYSTFGFPKSAAGSSA